jgi:hypothetical protein
MAEDQGIEGGGVNGRNVPNDWSDEMAHRPSRRGVIAERVFIVLCLLVAFALIIGVIGLVL